MAAASGALTTWWVTPDALERLGRRLVVPTAGGCWQVEPVEWSVGALRAQDVSVASPAGEVRPPPFSVVDAAGRSGERRGRVTAASADWLVVERESDVRDARGRGAPDRVPSATGFEPAHAGRPIGEVLGPDAERAFVAAGVAARGACGAWPDPRRWGVRHAAGGWEVYGTLAASPGCPAPPTVFRVPAPVPPGFDDSGRTAVAEGDGLRLDGDDRLRIDERGLHLERSDEIVRSVALTGARVVALQRGEASRDAARACLDR